MIIIPGRGKGWRWLWGTPLKKIKIKGYVRQKVYGWLFSEISILPTSLKCWQKGENILHFYTEF